MKDALIKLLKIKSIVTVVLTAVFAYLSIIGKIDSDNFMMIFTTVIAFYFGTQHEKENGSETTVIENHYTEEQREDENEGSDL